VDEHPNLGYDSEKVKNFGPQTGFEPTPLEEMSFQFESSTTELKRHPNTAKQNLESSIFMHFSVKILKRKRDFRDFRYRYEMYS
jgi:hypothetical protein